MGKAAKLKQLRRIARQLPDITYKRVMGEKVSGKELMGTEKDAAGNAIDPTLTYRQKRVVVVPLNHDRKLKQAYKRAGMAGAAMYANAVTRYAKDRQPEPEKTT